MKEFWNERYSAIEFAYGTEPNEFFKNHLDKFKANDKILFLAEGEGRNAVYAAKNGITSIAVDISEAGKEKALNLAKQNKVSLEYFVGDFLEMEIKENSFDGAALIYSHLPPNIRQSYFKKVERLLKPGGVIVIEGFSKNHLPYRNENPKVGGPDKVELLFGIEDMQNDFQNINFELLNEEEVELNEGLYHVGKGKVLRVIGHKR